MILILLMAQGDCCWLGFYYCKNSSISSYDIDIIIIWEYLDIFVVSGVGINPPSGKVVLGAAWGLQLPNNL